MPPILLELGRHLTPHLLGLLLTGLSLSVVLYLFCSLGREIRALEARCSQLGGAIEQLAAANRLEVRRLETRLEDVEAHAGMMVAPAPPPSGMNLNKRSQALRLLRMGEVPERVAASLQVPCKEVELLMKVQKLLSAGSG